MADDSYRNQSAVGSAPQTLDLMQDGAFGCAAINTGFSVILCVGAVAVGPLLAQYLNGGAARIAKVAIEENA